MPVPTKDRFEMRVLRSDKQLVSLAAEIEGVTLTRFVWEHAVKRARKIVAQAQRIQTTEKGYQQILDALENPPEPHPAMLQAMNRYLRTKAK